MKPTFVMSQKFASNEQKKKKVITFLRSFVFQFSYTLIIEQNDGPFHHNMVKEKKHRDHSVSNTLKKRKKHFHF